jgi:hypothetical protein
MTLYDAAERPWSIGHRRMVEALADIISLHPLRCTRLSSLYTTFRMSQRSVPGHTRSCLTAERGIFNIGSLQLRHVVCTTLISWT